MNDFELTVIDLLDEAIKHGKHNQASHGRRTARRRAYSAAYSEARAGGATPQEAREKAREAGLARQSERDVRLERLRARETPQERYDRKLDVEVAKKIKREREQFEIDSKKPFDDREKKLIEEMAFGAPGTVSSYPKSKIDDAVLDRAISSTRSQRDQLLANNRFREATEAQRTLNMYEEVPKLRAKVKEESERSRQLFSERTSRYKEAGRLQARADRGSKLTKSEQSRLTELRDRIVREMKEDFGPTIGNRDDETVYRETLQFFNR